MLLTGTLSNPSSKESTNAQPPPPRTKWTRRVPHPVLIRHAASLSQEEAAGGFPAAERPRRGDGLRGPGDTPWPEGALDGGSLTAVPDHVMMMMC